MEIEQRKIAQILQMNEREFAEFIYNAAVSGGLDRSKAEMVKSFAPMIRQKLKNTNEAELKKFIESVGEEKVRGILDSLAP